MEFIIGSIITLAILAAASLAADRWRKKRRWINDTRVVADDWLLESRFARNLQQQGYRLVWCERDEVAQRVDNGYQVIRDLHQASRTRFRICNAERQILMGKIR